MAAKVFLIAHSYNPVKTVAQAAKLCYSSSDIENLGNNLTEEKASEFVEMLSDLGHESPLEHASFTFGIEGVSRAFLAQITRHRIASYSVKSQRYVNENMFDFVIPPEIENDEKAKEIYLKAMQSTQRAYDELADILTEKHTARLIAEGKDEKEAKRAARKIANEDARFVLPNACETKMIVTMSVYKDGEEEADIRFLRQSAPDLLGRRPHVPPRPLRYPQSRPRRKTEYPLPPRQRKTA